MGRFGHERLRDAQLGIWDSPQLGICRHVDC